MKTLEQVKKELTELQSHCSTNEQFIEAVATMYLSCCLDRAFLAEVKA